MSLKEKIGEAARKKESPEEKLREELTNEAIKAVKELVSNGEKTVKTETQTGATVATHNMSMKKEIDVKDVYSTIMEALSKKAEG